MEFQNIDIPEDIDETLSAIYRKAKRHNPELNREIFLRQIIMEWLEPFKRNNIVTKTRKNTRLKNNLRLAIEVSEKSQSQVARDIGVHRSYITELIKGKYEPSITMAYLLAGSLGYPPERIKDLFYIESDPKE